MIENQRFTLKRTAAQDNTTLAAAIEEVIGPNALRWYVAEVGADELVIEASLSTDLDPAPRLDGGRHFADKSAAVNIIPTGVDCNIGGYAGDGAPATNLLASTVDYLITNPNAVNASDFISLHDNVVYTDGHSMDQFMRGHADLHVPRANRVGLIVERAEDWMLDVVFNVVNAVRAVHGADIVDCVVTDEPIGGRCVINRSGAVAGTIDNPQALYRASEKLIASGANAIAITSNIKDLPLADYALHFDGRFPNPVGGVEAIISYLISRRYQLPTAHAPLINIKELELKERVVDARGAGEFVSTSGLACILIGLRRAPQVAPEKAGSVAAALALNNLLAVVTPAGCLGGVPQLYAQSRRIPVIAVRDNDTILNVTQSKLGLGNVVEVHSYAEAAGVLMALKRGISLESIFRPLRTIRQPAFEAAEVAVGVSL
jgi:Protein of unknown function (DUF3326)